VLFLFIIEKNEYRAYERMINTKNSCIGLKRSKYEPCLYNHSCNQSTEYICCELCDKHYPYCDVYIQETQLDKFIGKSIYRILFEYLNF